MLENPRMRPAARAILGGGLCAGILDAVDAVVFFRATPLRVFQSIARGLLGSSAFDGGLATAALGVFLHFLIATTAAAVYWAASRRLRLLVRHPVACGLGYGVAVYFFMNYVVLPLSLAPAAAFRWPAFLNGVIGHALLVGLPIALIARRCDGKAERAGTATIRMR
jgi:predicted permease